MTKVEEIAIHNKKPAPNRDQAYKITPILLQPLSRDSSGHVIQQPFNHRERQQDVAKMFGVLEFVSEKENSIFISLNIVKAGVKSAMVMTKIKARCFICVEER